MLTFNLYRFGRRSFRTYQKIDIKEHKMVFIRLIRNKNYMHLYKEMIATERSKK